MFSLSVSSSRGLSNVLAMMCISDRTPASRRSSIRARHIAPKIMPNITIPTVVPISPQKKSPPTLIPVMKEVRQAAA